MFPRHNLSYAGLSRPTNFAATSSTSAGFDSQLRQKLADTENELMHYREIENQQTRTIRELQEQLHNQRLNPIQVQQLERENDELRQAIHALPIVGTGYGSGMHSMVTDFRSHDAALRKLREFSDGFQSMQQKVQTLENSLSIAEQEARRNQESVRKLIEDVERTRTFINSTDVMKERDAAVRQQERLQQELKTIESRWAQTNTNQDMLQKELRDKELRLGELDTAVRQRELASHAAAQELRNFKESLASLLTDGFIRVVPSEESIRVKIQQIVSERIANAADREKLEQKLKEVSEQLEEQAELHKKAVERAREAEAKLNENSDELKAREGELKANDILKNGWTRDKSKTACIIGGTSASVEDCPRHSATLTFSPKYSELLNQLADIMEMDKLMKHLDGVQLNGDTLLARAEQLVKFENEMGAKRKVEVQQLRDLKKDLASKDHEVDKLRKKLITMETQATVEAERDLDDVVEKNKKLVRQVEKMQSQIRDAVDYKTLKHTTEEQKKIIADLEDKLKEVGWSKEKYDRRIWDMKRDIQQNETQTQHTVHSLTAEVQRLKAALAETKKREKQLSDLRHVLARMLGLSTDSLAVPDYEIISRLEKLIEGQHARLIGDLPPNQSILDRSVTLPPSHSHSVPNRNRTATNPVTRRPQSLKQRGVGPVYALPKWK